MSGRILLADDDSSLRFVLSQALTKEGYAVRATSNVATLAKWARDGEGDVVLTDVYMGEDCVFDALPAIRAARPELPVIVMSAQSTVATALSANSAGAFDYVPKPFDLDALIATVRRALSRGPDASSRASAKKAARDENLPLIGRSVAMQEAFRTIAKVANSDLTVLIEGESGSGKSRAARAIHENSKRANAPFLSVSLAGADADDIEDGVFGGGGALARARGGVLYLRNLDDLSEEAQKRLAARLNREDEGAKPDVRLIVSSLRSLSAMTQQRKFRADLLHRLNIVTLRLPPLRERRDDLPDLARTFVLRAKREGLPEKVLDAGAIETLAGYDFPGNIRELENLLRRALALSPGSVISAADILAVIDRPLPPTPEDGGDMGSAIAERVGRAFSEASPRLPDPGLYDRLLAEFERPLIERALEATRRNQIKAAAVLGINRNTLRKKIQALGISTGARD